MKLEEMILKVADELEKETDPVEEFLLIMVDESLLEVYIRNIL